MCICPFLLVFLLMNHSSQFLILRPPLHWDYSENVFEKSQRIRKVSKCENQFIGRKMSKHWRNQGIKWTSNINNHRSLPPSGVILQCFCLSLHAPILQQQWTRFTEVFTSWNQPRDVHTGSSWPGESLPFSQWLPPGLAGTGLSTAV